MITSAKYQKYEIISETTFRITLRLTDDVAGVYDRGFIVSGSSLADLKDDASRQIAGLNASSAPKIVLDSVPLNANIPVTYTPPAATPFEVWLKAVQKWQSVKTLLVDTGVKTGAEAEIIALKTAAINGYNPVYLDNF